MKMAKRFRTLDEARVAYLDGKITANEFAALMRKHVIVDNERKQIEKSSKRIERKLATV